MPHRALRTILPVAGWPEDRANSVEITGGTDPVLPTPFRIGVAGSGNPGRDRPRRRRSVGDALGTAAAVAVDLRQATASLRSGHYMKLGDGEVSTARNTIMGVYPTKDGRWSYLHCQLPQPSRRRAAACSACRKIARRWRAPC